MSYVALAVEYSRLEKEFSGQCQGYEIIQHGPVNFQMMAWINYYAPLGNNELISRLNADVSDLKIALEKGE